MDNEAPNIRGYLLVNSVSEFDLNQKVKYNTGVCCCLMFSRMLLVTKERNLLTTLLNIL